MHPIEKALSKIAPVVVISSVYGMFLGIGLTVAGIYQLGPIDAGRALYNQMIGDMPVLKRGLVDYNRELQHHNYEKDGYTIIESSIQEIAKPKIITKRQLEDKLIMHFNGKKGADGRLDPQSASIVDLFEFAEKNGSPTDRIVGPIL